MPTKDLSEEVGRLLGSGGVEGKEHDEADEARVRAEFVAKYGRVGKTLLASRFKVVRDLALNVICLWEMLVDPDYQLAWTTKSSIIGALGYFVSPVDTIPDFAPGVGYLDDALVVAYVLHRIAGDVAAYRQFRREAGRPLPYA